MAGVKKELGYLAELVGMCALVVTQPVLAVFGSAPEEFTARRASPLAIAAFALAVAVLPALGLWLLEQPARLVGGHGRDLVHHVALGVLFGVLVVEVVKEATSAPPWSLMLAGVVAAVGFVVACSRWGQIRLTARYLALAAVAFTALFLFASPVSVLVIGGGVDAADVEVDRPAPVLMVVLDELATASLLDEEGGLDEERLPGFAALAEDATWYRNHTTVAPVTPSAVPAILTGTLPTELRPAPVAATFPDSLFTLLGDSHELRVDESFTLLCPADLCDAGPAAPTGTTVRALLGTARQVLGSVTSPWAERADLSFDVPTEPTDAAAPVRFAAFAQRVGEPTATGLPPLDFLHVLLPHQPFDFTPAGLRYEAPDPPRGVEFGSWFDDDTAALGRERHLWQLTLTDRLLGEMIDTLEAAGTYDETLVIVTADHGIAFSVDEPIRGVSTENADRILWTPLFIKPPGQMNGSIDDGRVETIDILPTIAEILGVDLPYEVDGFSRVDGGGPADQPARVLDWRFSTLRPESGDLVTVDAVDGYRRLLAAAPPGAGGDDPLAGQRIGPHGDLVGRPLSDVEAGPDIEIGLSLEIPLDGFAVAQGTLEVPAYVSGRYVGEPLGWTALALDGEVVAVARTYESGYGTSDLAALIPPERLTPGDHELEVFVIEGEGEDRLLRSAGVF
jgi:hypothetical protein